ncbi:MAG: hypothetical protein PHX43_09035, partial [Alphaproteobacteria bacterium]|nr:hypothetical protein [Alphaproteobacteria bacterium]
MVDTKDSTASPVHVLPPKVSRTLPPKEQVSLPTGKVASARPAAAAPVAGAKPVVRKVAKPANFSSMPFWTGVTLSIVWVAVVFLALVQGGASHSFIGVPLVNLAVGISAVSAPIGLIWMVTAYLQRAADVQSVAEPLRRQLMMITGESGLAEQRIRRFNHAIREQLDLLRSTKASSSEDLMAIIERVNQHKTDLEQFEHNSLNQVKEIQEVVRRSMQHIEQQMEDKFTMMRILDGKLVQSSDSVAVQTDAVREQLGGLLQEIEANSNLITISLERAMRDSKKLSDTARSQETSITSAADIAASTLGELSGKIDVNIARFLERAGSAREEAERMAGALDAQTRSLDELSATLPARVGEAEAVLRGVADRLYASEQLAREQAVQLSEKLSSEAANLQQVMDKFNARFTEIDGNMQQRRSDLDSLVVRVGIATNDLADQLEDSINGMDARADSSLDRFKVVNAEARKGIEEIAAHMTETTTRYESAASQLSSVSNASNAQIKAMSNDIANQLVQFEALQATARQTGNEVQNSAASAAQNLQYVLERLLAAREATQLVGENLTSKMRSAVDENEALISRINEAAQMSVRALGIATESVGSQEGKLITQTRAAEEALRDTMAQFASYAQTAEKTMRDQSTSMNSLLNETTSRVNQTEKSLQDFGARAMLPVQEVMQKIDVHSENGLASLDRYGEKMQDKLGEFQKFNAKVEDMGEDVARNTSETLDAFEQLNARFNALRAEQEEIARATIDKFNQVAERLQSQVGSLGEQTTASVGLLQEASTRVIDQTQALVRDSQDAGSKLQTVTSALQGEAMQTRAALQKQADDLNVDLSRAEQQFASIGEALKHRTDSAYSLIDRVAVHYSETTRKAADEIEARTTKLEHVTSQANGKVEALNSALLQQLNLIGNGAGQLEAQTSQIAAASGKTVQQLNAINEKFVSVQDNMAATSQASIAKLDEASSAFIRQHSILTDTAQNAVVLVQKATNSFGEQATKMAENSRSAEQQVRNLGSTTTVLSDQISQVRATMEKQSQTLIASLNDAVGQMDAASAKMQSVVSSASLGADQVSGRFDALTQNATSKIGSSGAGLAALAESTEAALGKLGGVITQQASSLGLISEQLAEQQNSAASANENQRVKMMELFERLESAHAQASEVADRTIERLSDSLQQIQRHLGALSDQSQGAIANVRTAAGGFADQAGMLLQHAQQAEQQARTVLSVTGSLQEQARELRESLHQEGERTSGMLSGLLSKMATGSAELREVGVNAEGSLTSLKMDMEQQTTALSSAMQQIGERQRSLTTALDAQRDVLNGLLCRLSLAQDETASTAERSATRLADSAQQVAKQVEAIDNQTKSTLASVRLISGS